MSTDRQRLAAILMQQPDGGDELLAALASGYGTYVPPDAAYFAGRKRERMQRQNAALRGVDSYTEPAPEPPAINPIPAGNDQASFLRSEKETAPYWETDHRSLLAPLVMSGYNNSVRAGVPTIFGGQAWSTMNDIVEGRPVSIDELKHSANDVAGAAMLGSPLAKAPAGSLRSGAARSSGAAERSLDPLGYYSKALEEAKALQPRGTIEQHLATLKNRGVKDAEIEATGLASAFPPGTQVTRDDVVKHLTDNRVGLNEVTRGASPAILEAEAQRNFGRSYDELSPRDQRDIGRMLNNSTDRTKWSKHSLDPLNPTYRETVLHLPSQGEVYRSARIGPRNEFRSLQDRYSANESNLSPAEFSRMEELRAAIIASTRAANEARARDFQSGHFPEPNIVGHTMTSVNKLDGRPTYTLDQIQSDWGQKLRDGGVRNEAKIEELKKRWNALKAEGDRLADAGRDPKTNRLLYEQEWLNARKAHDLVDAELRTAEAFTPGNPLVNTTDQWTNTVLRRAIRNAISENADHIAVPSGKTVLSYNPGNEHGMSAFYDNIVPKNLGNILDKLDKGGANRRAVDQLETPSGMKGSGFTIFDITPKMREEAAKGMPLFSNPKTSAAAPLYTHDSQDDTEVARLLKRYGLAGILGARQ
jgi:hypothetical protein